MVFYFYQVPLQSLFPQTLSWFFLVDKIWYQSSKRVEIASKENFFRGRIEIILHS